MKVVKDGSIVEMKTLYQLRGFQGPDASLDISLFDYGLAMRKKPKKDCCNIIYNAKCYNNTDFYYASFDKKDWEDLISESWFNIEKVADCNGCTIEELKDFNLNNLYSAILYHGTENIFGSVYHDGFKIYGNSWDE